MAKSLVRKFDMTTNTCTREDTPGHVQRGICLTRECFDPDAVRPGKGRPALVRSMLACLCTISAVFGVLVTIRKGQSRDSS